jgi:hypothetical protein
MLATRSGAMPYNPILATRSGAVPYMVTMASTRSLDALLGLAISVQYIYPTLATHSRAAQSYMLNLAFTLLAPDDGNTLGGWALHAINLSSPLHC